MKLYILEFPEGCFLGGGGIPYVGEDNGYSLAYTINKEPKR